jgi:peroxiredoxin Q/BCP
MNAGNGTKARQMADLPGPGAKAPPFSLPRQGGGSLALKDLMGRKLVLFFYPRAGTPGCSREAAAFARLHRQFARSGIVVIGISADPPKALDKFAADLNLPYPLLSDESKRILQAYGVWKKKQLYGRSFMGIERTTYLIDEQGKIAQVWPRVRVDGHAEDVLAAAKEL